MQPPVDQAALNRYVRGQSPAAEAAAVREWLVQPENQLLAQFWMQTQWDQPVDVATIPAREPDYNQLLSSLHQQLGFESTEMTSAETATPRWRYWAAAASAGALLAAGSLWWQQQHAQPVAAPLAFATPYAQTRQIQLPDGSEVTLNSHSTLRYAPGKSADQPREVWLDGEAYFSVQHLPSHQPFVVHTTAGVNVEVLGTKFTIYRRHAEAKVVLLSGKVRLTFADKRPAVIMKPGELVATVDSLPQQLVHKPVPTTLPYASWKDDKLVLDETTIAELATRLHDTYGVDVVVKDPTLNARRITGTVPIGALNVLLQALQETFKLKIERQQNQIILSDANSPTSHISHQ
ncbi:FecR family protein [Hymenobacter crusticola]|nr:FecR domain-containing protein [Hymenobacter crusticola]